MAEAKKTSAKKTVQKPVIRSIATRADGVNLREGPSLNSVILAVMKNGASVEVDLKGKATSKEWTPIICNGTHGYVMTEYLK